MKPADFRYARPATLDEALTLMAGEGEIAALAGGQSLMPMMNFRIAQPEVLVDLNAVADLAGVTEMDGTVRIGAMTRYSDLARHDVLARLPLVARALPHVAHPSIRNRGTLGGSLALADPAAELPAVALALGAKVHLASTHGTRSVAADDFFQGLYETDRAEDELVTAIDLPAATAQETYGFHEVARRHGDYAMAGVALTRRDDGLRIAFFSVSDRPVRAKAAETVLRDDPTKLDLAIEALDEIDFTGDLNGGPDMKRHLAGVVLRRAWAEVLA